ncbi:MAG: 16S rRNA (uracil(1498)-N(3))-methyltransferase [Desulfobacteraceae bacterium]
MNLILLFEQDFIDDSKVRIGTRRLEHLARVHRAAKGKTFKVGLVNGPLGTGKVIQVTDAHIEMAVTLTQPPPAPLPLTLVLALPRPKMLKRILQAVTTLGIKKIYLINAWKVEKSFWKSPVMEETNLEQQLVLGLEQCRDTIMPEIFIRRLFTPFVREELPVMAKNAPGLVAHPKTDRICPENLKEETLLAVGPEGGFIDMEIETFEQAGFQTISLGERILRTETAVPALVSRLF